MAKINKWQQRYLDEYYGSSLPKRWDTEGKEEFDLLGKCKDTVTVHLSTGIDTYKITLDECNIPKGIISVCVLAANLRFWKFRGFTIEF